MKPILIVSATQQSTKNINDLQVSKSICFITQSDYKNNSSIKYKAETVTENTDGLSKVYNRYITPEYAEKFDFIVFCHDDVFIDDGMLQEKLYKAHNELKYDIIGVAGGIDPVIEFPTLWHIMCKRENHRGQAAHPAPNNTMYTTVFGQTPSRVVIADGSFLAVHLPTILKTPWKFNENYNFHHYDIASCIDAHKMGLKVGVYPIYIIHNSSGLEGGVFEPNWLKSNNTFLAEYASRK